MHRRLFPAFLIVCFTISLLAFAGISSAGAPSDWTAVYARIDKVVLEPNATTPDRIQIWGAFALASKEDRNSYGHAVRGYLYYSLAPGKETICRKEWADFKAAAGTNDIIGFGWRNQPRARVRQAGEKPADPDVYPVANGLVKMSDRMSEYSPIRELRSLPKGQQ